MLKLLVIIFSIFLSCNVFSDIYKCKDSSGKYKFQDKPCLIVDEAVSVKQYDPGSINSSSSDVDSEAIKEAKKLVRSTLLFQPDRAVFTNMQQLKGPKGEVVCGKVDIINLAGRYIGYKQFVVHKGEMTWVKRLARKNATDTFGSALNREYEKSLAQYLSLGCPKY